MAFKMKKFSGFKDSPAKLKQKKDPYTKKDYEFLKRQREERVKSIDYLTKTPVGPRATKKKVKKEQGLEGSNIPLSPGYEDPIKIQKLQREGLTPGSQKFRKKAKAKTKAGEGFMRPPYKKPVGPTEKRKAYHGYKNFKSILKK